MGRDHSSTPRTNASRSGGVPDHLFQISLRSLCTAMLAGLRTLIQTRHGPDRYGPSTRLETTAGKPALGRDARGGFRGSNSLVAERAPDNRSDRMRLVDPFARDTRHELIRVQRPAIRRENGAGRLQQSLK
jgi:hypothetical protein